MMLSVIWQLFNVSDFNLVVCVKLSLLIGLRKKDIYKKLLTSSKYFGSIL